jgi:hypothetical protein
MALFAEGLFRLDVVLNGDTMRTIVRNLSTDDLVLEEGSSSDTGVSMAFGDALEYEPGMATLRFALGTGADRVWAEVMLATLRHEARGTIQVTAQAIVRGRSGQAPA